MVATAEPVKLVVQPDKRYAGLIPFDPERARLAGQKSAQVRRQRALDRANAIKPVEPTQVQAAVYEQLKLVAEQIASTRAVLNDDRSDWCEHCERGGMAPHHRAQLLKALDALLDRQRKLLGIADPAPVRASSKKPAAPGLVVHEPQ